MKALAIPERISSEVDERDVEVYRRITSTELTEEEKERIRRPSRVYPRQDSVLALHWHPEFVPLELAVERVEAMFPNAEDTLVIPTQHNVPLEWRGYTGVEVDSYSPGFQRKVQILFHFSADKLRNRGDVFRAMCAHTRKYRASQLHELIDSLLESKFSDRVEEAAEATGATDEIVGFVRAHVSRLKSMMERFESSTPPQMLKNKLIRNYFDALRDRYDDRLINHVKLFVKAVKKIVKARFSLEYFYETREVIEEARSLGGGVVIPHPEQFWPILLDDLDVDGIEVWNPQSFQYTNFLIDVVYRQNKSSDRRRRLLVTMGDDCHLGEKVKDPRYQDPAKAGREVGLQPMWEDLRIRKRLIVADQSRRRVIEEYRGRLDG
jgi:hypothetical protein